MLPARPLPTSLSELILPYQPKLSHTLTSLKKDRLRIHRRLTSILEDSAFVTHVASANNLPLVANERCGSWYVPTEQKCGSVYFKSTDGHQGQWQFSLRRLNLGIFEILSEHGGAIVVDSTRRGKSMPDALSKTLPIWVAVMNRVLFPERLHVHGLRTPEDVVGRSEHSLIEQRLDGAVRDFKNLGLDCVKLKTTVGKPIHVEFISRQTSVVQLEKPTDCHLLICCSASRHEHGDGDNYVQGAGDDTETWAHGLTAETFWKHKDRLLEEVNEENLQSLIEEISTGSQVALSGSTSRVCLQETATTIFVGTSSESAHLDMTTIDAMVLCESEKGSSNETSITVLPKSLPILELGCIPGKLGGRTLRDKLPLIEPFLRSLLVKSSNPRILITCSTGKDISIGVALAVICRFVDDEGILNFDYSPHLNKTHIRQKLACIIQSHPQANPSRATLQSVNTYLMGYV